MKKIILVFVVLTSIPAAQAADPRWTVGALAGVGVSFASGGGSSFVYGLEAQRRFESNVTAGLYYYRNSSSTTVTSITTSSSVNNLGVEAAYWLDAAFYLGARVGTVFTSNSVTGSSIAAANISNTSTDFEVGPQVGYDVEVAPDVTLGVNADVIFTTITGSKPVMDLFGAARFWF